MSLLKTLSIPKLLLHTSNIIYRPSNAKESWFPSKTQEKLTHYSKRALTPSTPPHTHKPVVHQPAFGYHPTPAEPHQYTSTHRNRYVITLAYDNRTYPGHIILTHHAPMNPQINTHQKYKTLMHKHLSLQNNAPTYSRRLLRMNVITFETCWAIKNFHKVTSSWFNLLKTSKKSKKI
jgi:hypothetical protein